FTQSKDGKIVYALQLLNPGQAVPAEISFSGLDVPSRSTIQLIGSNKKLKWKKEGDTVKVSVPKTTKAEHAIAIKISLRGK
ncbi:MAG: hypothetical protein JST09_04015, partial [Bacteroidetes bacterium]|nr:hypothetical protein [Bacteroidota bacterium]